MNRDKYPPLEIIAADDALKLDLLASHLCQGQLALALGAGVSNSFGFPRWWELVHNIQAKYEGNSSVAKETPVEELKHIIHHIENDIGDDKKYNKLVRSILYANIDYTKSDLIIQNKLLISIGALAMGGRRGSVNNIITYNFDDLLEWYFGFLGFDVRVIYNPRIMTTNSDIVIYHPNGFLPSQNKFGIGKLVFSKISFINRDRGTTQDDKLWGTIIERLFIDKIFVFVGLSGRDSGINDDLMYIFQNQLERTRPIGYWFFNHESEIADRQIDQHLERGIIPIVVKDNKDIPEFILKLCQKSLSFI